MKIEFKRARFNLRILFRNGGSTYSCLHGPIEALDLAALWRAKPEVARVIVFPLTNFRPEFAYE